VFRDVRQISTEAADGFNGADIDHPKTDSERSPGTTTQRYDADAT
jgi:hypothetical protein